MPRPHRSVQRSSSYDSSRDSSSPASFRARSSSSSSSGSSKEVAGEGEIQNHRLDRYCSGGTQGGFRTTFSTGHRHHRVTVVTTGYGPLSTRHRTTTSVPSSVLLPSAPRTMEHLLGMGGRALPSVAALSVTAPGMPYGVWSTAMMVPGRESVSYPSPSTASSVLFSSGGVASSFANAPGSSKTTKRLEHLQGDRVGESGRPSGEGGTSSPVGPPTLTPASPVLSSRPPLVSSSSVNHNTGFSPSAPLYFGAARFLSQGCGQGNTSVATTRPTGKTGGGGGATLRYRTDINQPTIHFMMERLLGYEEVKKVEEITFAGREEEKDRDWHLFWMSVNRIRTLFQSVSGIEYRLLDHNIINHYPNHYELTRKDLMYRNIKNYIKEASGWGTSREKSGAGGGGGGVGSTGTAGVCEEGLPWMIPRDHLNVFLTIPSHKSEMGPTMNGGKATVSPGSGNSSHHFGPSNKSSGIEEGRGAPIHFTEGTQPHPSCFQAAAWRFAGGTGAEKKCLPLTLPVALNWQAAASFAGAAPSLSTYERHARLAEWYSFADSVPISYQMPNDMSTFIEEFKKNTGMTWIVKPTSRSQGKGIFLVQKLPQFLKWVKERKEVEQQISYGLGSSVSGNSSSQGGGGGSSVVNSNAGAMLSSFIVSKYISNPLLIGGKKFDLRLYVLVTSFKPVVAYLHECGFARFCATKYTSKCMTEEDLGSHLTNVALQKGEDDYNTAHGGKWLVRQLLLYIESRYGPYKAEGLMAKIKFLLFQSLLAVKDVIQNDRHCFELYGYDILIDDQLNPHLIEVNASPSLSATTTTDRLIKEEVLSDVMRIVIPPGFVSSHAPNSTGEGHGMNGSTNTNAASMSTVNGNNTSTTNTNNGTTYISTGSAAVAGGGGGSSNVHNTNKPWLYAEHRTRSDIGVTLGTGFTLL